MSIDHTIPAWLSEAIRIRFPGRATWTGSAEVDFDVFQDFVYVEGDPANESDWENMVGVHEVILRQDPDFKANVVLGGAPNDVRDDL